MVFFYLLGIIFPFTLLAFHYRFSFSWPTVIIISVKTRKFNICWCWIHFYLQFHPTLSLQWCLSSCLCPVKNIGIHRQYFPPAPFPVLLGRLYAAVQPKKKPLWYGTMKAPGCWRSVWMFSEYKNDRKLAPPSSSLSQSPPASAES